jgi:alkylation response protein AidB-like acyl-CoA dehydrogenase
VPDADLIGEVDQGWTVGTRWMVHERMLFNSPLTSIPVGSGYGSSSGASLLEIARTVGRFDDPAARELIGESRTLALVREAMEGRIGEGIRSGKMSDQASAVGRLMTAIISTRTTTISFELSGAFGGTWAEGDGPISDFGTDFLMRQASCIGGGTTEMARNVVSERVLGMPRELSLDRNVAFSQVPRGPSANAG